MSLIAMPSSASPHERPPEDPSKGEQPPGDSQATCGPPQAGLPSADAAPDEPGKHDAAKCPAPAPAGALAPAGTAPDIVAEEESAEEKIERCQRIVEHRFANVALLQSALTHASGAMHRLGNNERLEFLGDSVLGMVVCEWLYQEYPEYSEGDLTKIKSSVVSRRSCGKVACELGLEACLIVGKGIHRGRSFPRSLVSDVFEAVVAAIYLDAGLDAVRARLRKWLAAEVRGAVEGRGSGNYKSVLQQYAQRERSSTPFYRLVTESGPDHRKRFRVAAVIAGEEFQPAWGNNKKDAEQHAAANALAALHHEPPPFE